MINVLLSPEWLLRLSQFNQIIVGFSGGLDSTVLLHVLAAQPTLRSKLVAVHVHHGLNANASFWQEHCKQVCQQAGIVFRTQAVTFDSSANIEERARIARYSVFSSLVSEQNCLILGHHLDDQAETVLLQLFRGTGIDGLAAMPEVTHFGQGLLLRPFLSYSREQLAEYALMHQLKWIDDESNSDTAYSRNYLRQEIIPLLQHKWPGVVGNIARTASHCQQAKRNLDALAAHDLLLQGQQNPPSEYDCPANLEKQHPLTTMLLPLAVLKNLSFDRIVNVLRVWLKHNQIQLPSTHTLHRLIHEVIFASPDAVPSVCWGGIAVRRYQDHLYLDTNSREDLPSYLEWRDFPLPLILAPVAIKLIAQQSKQGLIIPQDARLSIRFRQGGEDFLWHGQTKRLKKLFQEWAIPPWLRARIPLLYVDDTLAMVVGYAISDVFFSQDATDAWLLHQVCALSTD